MCSPIISTATPDPLLAPTCLVLPGGRGYPREWGLYGIRKYFKMVVPPSLRRIYTAGGRGHLGLVKGDCLVRVGLSIGASPCGDGARKTTAQFPARDCMGDVAIIAPRPSCACRFGKIGVSSMIIAPNGESGGLYGLNGII